MTKTLGVQYSTPLTFSSNHLGYITEEAGPPTYFQPVGEHVDDVIFSLHEISMHTSEENLKMCLFLKRCAKKQTDIFGGLYDNRSKMLQ